MTDVFCDFRAFWPCWQAKKRAEISSFEVGGPAPNMASPVKKMTES
jgi:hypothetical protein